MLGCACLLDVSCVVGIFTSADHKLLYYYIECNTFQISMSAVLTRAKMEVPVMILLTNTAVPASLVIRETTVRQVS